MKIELTLLYTIGHSRAFIEVERQRDYKDIETQYRRNECRSTSHAWMHLALCQNERTLCWSAFASSILSFYIFIYNLFKKRRDENDTKIGKECLLQYFSDKTAPPLIAYLCENDWSRMDHQLLLLKNSLDCILVALGVEWKIVVRFFSSFYIHCHSIIKTNRISIIYIFRDFYYY